MFVYIEKCLFIEKNFYLCQEMFVYIENVFCIENACLHRKIFVYIENVCL